MRVIKILLLLAGAIVLLTACGSGSGGGSGGGDVGGGGGVGSGGGSSAEQGRFVDSSVEGVHYVSGSQSGLTDAQGTFLYGTGTDVQFFIGDILVGQTSGKPVITPVDFVQLATHETDPIVTNITRFLLTLDNDSDPGNGIRITAPMRNAATGMSVDFRDESDVQIVADTLTGGRSLVSIPDAQAHLLNTIMSFLSGTYNGTFSGDASGTWTITINLDGVISGHVDDDFGNSITATGNATSAGTMRVEAGSVFTGAIFSGTISLTGIVSGTWVDNNTGERGTYSGTKQ